MNVGTIRLLNYHNCRSNTLVGIHSKKAVFASTNDFVINTSANMGSQEHWSIHPDLSLKTCLASSKMH